MSAPETDVGFFEDADLIHSYSRAQALEDGVLVDAGPLAEEAGFRYPLVLSRAAWEATVHWSRITEDGLGQSEQGRLWDVLWVAAFHAKRNPTGKDILHFAVNVIPNERGKKRAGPVGLYMRCGPGDTRDPVLTIMLEGED